MKLNRLSDRQLLDNTTALVQLEREYLSKILKHLREIERRRLYSELGYKSLMEYAMGELKYSESAAYRRVCAMRLIKEIPEVEEKVGSGSLSLSNVTQAQSFFRKAKDKKSNRPFSKRQKLALLNKLENKSAREGKKELFKVDDSAAMPSERERQVSEKCIQVSFVMDEKLKETLEEVRSLLGSKGASMSYSELFTEMATHTVASLKAKKFGKKRASRSVRKEEKTSTSETKFIKSSRYIPKSVCHEVWLRDGGRCAHCGGRQHLNYDHVVPVARGGASTVENLRLLCFSCNQRAAMRVFGVDFMERAGSRARAYP